MSVMRSPLRTVLRSPVYSPLLGKWADGAALSQTLELSVLTIAEDATIGIAIGTLSVSNLGELTVSSYAITSDPDSKFAIDGDDLEVDAALDYETATSHSVTIAATLSDASTVERTFTITVTNVGAPDQFGPSDWSVADDATGGDITITISALPDSDSPITDLEYQLDGGSWISLAGTTTGDYGVSGLTDDQEYDVAIRAVSAEGNGTASATKTVTPTAPAGPPVIASYAQGGIADTASMPVSLPSGVQAGDILLLIWHSGGTDVVPGTPGGWSREGIAQETGASLAGAVYWKIAGPSETGFNIVHGSAVTQGYRIYRITGGQDVESIAAGNAGGGWQPDPSNLAPSWGSAENLWIAGFGHARATLRTLSAYPSGYTDNQVGLLPAAFDGAAVDIGFASASKVATAASDNPAAFTVSSVAIAVAHTIAVRPG